MLLWCCRTLLVPAVSIPMEHLSLSACGEVLSVMRSQGWNAQHAAPFLGRTKFCWCFSELHSWQLCLSSFESFSTKHVTEKGKFVNRKFAFPLFSFVPLSSSLFSVAWRLMLCSAWVFPKMMMSSDKFQTPGLSGSISAMVFWNILAAAFTPNNKRLLCQIPACVVNVIT